MNDDTISRQAAIREYQKVCNGIKCGECPFLIKVNTEKGSHLITDCKLEAFLHNLPSAEWHGRWIKKYRGNYLCSVCGAWYRTTDDYGNIIDGEMTANYCESCGTKMDEVSE